MTARIWAIFLVAAVAVFAVLEGYALATGTVTLSAAVKGWAGGYWPLAIGLGSYAAGLLTGHFWWGQKE